MTDDLVRSALMVIFGIVGFFLGLAIIVRFFQAVSFLERIAKASEESLSLLKGRQAVPQESSKQPALPRAT